MAYLDTHKPKRTQFRARRTSASGVIVVHTAENTPDTIGLDGAAEAVAGFIARRADPGSYHRLADSDSVVNLVEFWYAAYGDGTGSNDHAIHISGATQAHKWKSLPKDWVDGTVRNMAKAASEASDYIFKLHGVRIPARRITRAQSDQRVEGFITHGERDPGRRTDPGKDFPWEKFFAYYTEFEAAKTGGATQQEEISMKWTDKIVNLDHNASSKERRIDFTLARTAARALSAYFTAARIERKLDALVKALGPTVEDAVKKALEESTVDVDIDVSGQGEELRA